MNGREGSKGNRKTPSKTSSKPASFSSSSSANHKSTSKSPRRNRIDGDDFDPSTSSSLPQSEVVSDAEEDDSSNVENGVAGAGAGGGGGDGEEKDVGVVLSDVIDQLSEKRSSTRITALGNLIDLLRSQYLYESISPKAETLQLYLLNSIKKGEAIEAQQACIATALLSLTLGGESETMYNQFSAVLIEIVKNKAKSPVTRASTSRLLAFLAFLSSHPDADIASLLTIYSDALSNQAASSGGMDPTLVEAILQSWGLVTTTLNTRLLATTVIEKELKGLIKLLEHTSVEVRQAAGEDIALLFSAHNEIQAIESDAEEEEEEEEKVEGPDVPSTAAAPTSSESIPSKKSPSAPKKTILTDDLLNSLSSLLKQLSTDGNRHRARKDRAKQRSTFRDVVRTVEDGDQPTETLILNKQKYEFEGWNQLKQLEAITEYLGKGLQIHFQENQVLGEIFELGGGGIGGGAGGGGGGGGANGEPDKFALRQASRGRAKEAYLQHKKSRSKKMRAVMQDD